MAKKTTTSKRVVKVEANGEAHVSSTFNNVIVSLTNAQGHHQKVYKQHMLERVWRKGNLITLLVEM